MAHIHGKPGRYCRQEADRRLNRGLILAMASAVIYGIVIGIFCFRRATFLGWGIAAAALLSLWAAPRLFEKPLTSLAKERIKYLRGAQGEAFVGWLLQQLDDNWHVFHGMYLKKARDIDHIVVGPGGVFCISTKNYRGLFSLAGDGRVFHNNQPTGLIGDTSAQTFRVRDRLGALLGADVPFVNAVLAVPQAFVEFQGPQQKNVWVLHQDNLIDTLEGGPKRLDKAQIQRYVKVLEMLAASAKDVYRPVASEPAAAESPGSTPADKVTSA